MITSSGDFSNRAEEHLAVALRNGGTINMPEGGKVQLVDYQTPLKAVRADAGIGKVDLLGVTEDGTIAVIELKVGSSREDPRVGLVEGLIYAAIIEANVETIARELEARFQREIRRERPHILLLAPPPFWTSRAGSSVRELQDLAAGLHLEGISVQLLSLDADLASYGLSGAKPMLNGVASCEELPARFTRGSS